MMHELQQRIQEAEETARRNDLKEGLSETEGLVVDLRAIEAKIKYLEDERDQLRAEIRVRLEDGESIGSNAPGVGYMVLQPSSPRVTFDYKQAMMDGLFSTKDAEPYLKTTTPKPSLVYRKPQEK